MACVDSNRKLAYTLKDLTLQLESDNDDTALQQKCASSRTKESSFDILLTHLWEGAMSDGLFRYKLTKNSLPFKVLPGKFNYIAQLNPDRAQKRRQPQEIQSVNQPFNSNEFHFNKVDPKEVILTIEPPWNPVSDAESPAEHLLLINVSPLEHCHVLLTPFRSQCKPQNLTRESLRLALEICLLSNSPDFRVGFNSLCGFASVNHEHYHAYYLSHRLFIEQAPLVKLSSDDVTCPWLLLEDATYPPGFCVALTDLSENGMDAVLNPMMRLATYFQSNDVGHNVYITRGSTKNVTGHFDSVRVFIWARKSSFGAKACEAFCPALCELGGHFSIKSQGGYTDITEEFILGELHEICDEPFIKTREWIISQSWDIS